MNIKKIKPLCFSPTGTTRRTLENIISSMGIELNEIHDFSCSSKRSEIHEFSSEDLAIIGVPVHYGRVPVIATEYLNKLKGKNTPALIYVVYGNRHYDDALIELRDIIIDRGFIPVAGGVFIGEHNISTDKTPIAKGRPNTSDASIERLFGKEVFDKVKGIDDINTLPILEVPGSSTYIKIPNFPDVSPVTKIKKCIDCGKCVTVCPVDAIDKDNNYKTNKNTCLTCYACTRSCPTHARIVRKPLILIARRVMSLLLRKEKMAEVFYINEG